MSPGFRNSFSMQQDGDMPSQTCDFNRMLQQHLSEGASSTTYRSTLHNIQENEQDENTEIPSSPEVSPAHAHSSNIMMGSITTGASHREGPSNISHDRSLFHSLYGQTTGTSEPNTSDLTTADMCLSTLYLHELFHQQRRRRSGSRQQQQQQQQQHQWQNPHRDNTQTPSLQSSQSHTRSTNSPYPEQSRSAAEKTPLLHPKKT